VHRWSPGRQGRKPLLAPAARRADGICIATIDPGRNSVTGGLDPGALADDHRPATMQNRHRHALVSQASSFLVRMLPWRARLSLHSIPRDKRRPSSRRHHRAPTPPRPPDPTWSRDASKVPVATFVATSITQSAGARISASPTTCGRAIPCGCIAQRCAALSVRVRHFSGIAT
jgi:hypothetical protein